MINGESGLKPVYTWFSVLELAQIVGHTNSKMILENYARFIKGEHLKINRSFNPFHNGGDIRGDTEQMQLS